ncbi:MAG: GTP diphosphokinase, partial [Methylococcales bacterium]|nr:GTP diphosphokinase [Methylococcales bacterium]
MRAKKTFAKSVVSVAGIDNVQTSFAHCCTPVSGEDIIGYISHHKGITVHRSDCKNIKELGLEKQAQLISVSWGDKKTSHVVPIVINAFNAQNLLHNVSQMLTQAKIHIFNAALETQTDLSATLNLTLQIENTNQLAHVLSKISCLPNIIDVKRKT